MVEKNTAGENNKRKALGRGLSALISTKPVPTLAPKASQNIVEISLGEDSSNKINYIPISKLQAGQSQPRQFFDEKELQELASSIKSLGIIQPILVREKTKDSYEIIAGERRYRAAKIAGLSEVPVILQKFSDEEAAEVALIENIQRSDLNPMEEAQAYQLLIDKYSLTQAQLSEKIGKDRSSIANLLRLLNLPEEIQSAIKDSQITLGHAKAILSVKEPGAQRNLLQKILNEHLSVRELEHIVSREVQLKKSTKSGKKLPKSSDYPEVNDRLRQTLGTRTEIQAKPNGSGKIIIDFFSDSDLQRIMDIVVGV